MQAGLVAIASVTKTDQYNAINLACKNLELGNTSTAKEILESFRYEDGRTYEEEIQQQIGKSERLSESQEKNDRRAAEIKKHIESTTYLKGSFELIKEMYVGNAIHDVTITPETLPYEILAVACNKEIEKQVGLVN